VSIPQKNAAFFSRDAFSKWHSGRDNFGLAAESPHKRSRL